MKSFLKLAAIFIFVIAALHITPNIKVAGRSEIGHAEAAEKTNMTETPHQQHEPLKTAEKASKKEPAKAPEKDPNGCEKKGMWYRADNKECIEKPAAAASNKAPSSSGSGSCAAEISKYNWNQNVALAVAKAESGLDPGIVNNDPSTGDYSIGCFQVNIYGANARTRPSEAALKDAETNVRWAYNNYVGNGRSFIGQWGVCRAKVACY